MLLTRSLESLAAISLVSGVMADSVGSSGHQGAAGACALLQQKVPHIVHFPGSCTTNATMLYLDKFA